MIAAAFCNVIFFGFAAIDYDLFVVVYVTLLGVSAIQLVQLSFLKKPPVYGERSSFMRRSVSKRVPSTSFGSHSLVQYQNTRTRTRLLLLRLATGCLRLHHRR